MEININVREKHQLVGSCTCPGQGPNCSPGMCPHWESNPRPLGSQEVTQTNSTTPVRALSFFFFYFKLLSKPTLSDHFDFSWRRMPTCILNTSTLSFLTCKDINNINCVNLLLNKTQSQKLKFHWLLA